jgi:hypothetical protein
MHRRYAAVWVAGDHGSGWWRHCGGQRVGELVDLFEEVGEDALGFLAAAGDGEFDGDGAEVVQGAADLDQAVVQLVDGLGILVRIVDDVAAVVDAGRLLMTDGQRSRRFQRRGWREHAADGEVDGAVDDGAAGTQSCGTVVDREHRLLPMLGQDGSQRPQPGRAWQQGRLVFQRSAVMLLEREQDGALGC